MVEDDQQRWGRSARNNPQYSEHDAAIDRAIAATYGGQAAPALQESDGNRQQSQTRATSKSKQSSGHNYSASRREQGRAASVSRSIGPKSMSSSEPLKGTEKGKWIHRDKLALIEVQEYKDAGLEPPQELLRRLAESRAETIRDDSEALRKIKTPDLEDYEDAQEEQDDEPQSYHQHHGSTEDYDASYVPDDPRSPDEIAAEAEAEANGHYDHQGAPEQSLRSSGSRLPVSANNPRPPSQDTNGTKTRTRKDSVGSNVILDDEPLTPTTRSTFGANSPSKLRKPSTTNKEKGKGKYNTISNIPKTRSTSTGRPGTAGEGRPRTATNPPEGDPPWLTGMYKPDPRLPPDQQILPTHARRIAQEQWEKEGKNAQTFDRDFNPLVGFDDSAEAQAAEKARYLNAAGQSSAQSSPNKETFGNGLGISGHPNGEWPLTNSRTPSPTKKRANGGGYSTVPRVTDSPKPAVGLFPSPRPGDQPAAEGGRPVTRNGHATPNHEQLGLETRVTGGLVDPEKAEESKKRGGCGCCVVM